jgi:hypothetical protein
VLALVCQCACAARYTPFEIDSKLGQTLSAARFYLESKRELEAEQLVRAVERIDPEFYGLAELTARLPAENRDLFRPSWLGANRARRYASPRPIGERILLFIPDRLLDALDIVSLEGHVGPGLYGEAHVTAAARFAAGLRVVGGLGTYFRRVVLGTRVQGNAALHALGAGPLRGAGLTAGSGSMASAIGNLSSARSPTSSVYQSYEDYWSIGASGTFAFAGASAELHLIQLADWIGGFLGFDLGNDDVARTRTIELQRSELDLIQELAEIEQSQDMVAEYRRRRPELQIPGLQIPADKIPGRQETPR